MLNQLSCKNILATVVFGSLMTISSHCRAAWIQKAPFGGTAKHRCMGFSIGNKGYIGGGHINSGITINYKDFWEYDPATNSWTQIADFGGGYRYHGTSFTVGNYGYVGLGENENSEYKNDFWKYIPLINTWVQVANFPGEARRGACSFVLGDTAYVGTGQANSGYKTDFYKYSFSSNTWQAIAPFIGQARSSAVAFSNNGKGYVGTGHIIGNDTKDFYCYDPVTNSWIQKSDVGLTNRQDATGFVINGIGYIGTGNDVAGDFNFDDFWAYDFDTDTWNQIADFDGQGRRYMVSFVINNVAYCGTGTNGTNFRDFWAFVPFLNTEKNSEALEITAYPNPSTDFIKINWTRELTADISVYNLAGELVFEKDFYGSSATLYKDLIGPGMFTYLIKFDENVFSNGKIIFVE